VTQTRRFRTMARRAVRAGALALLAALAFSASAQAQPLTISPGVAALTFTRTWQFTASAGGVLWYVDGVQGGAPSTGTISTSGLYTPPAAVGTHTVTVKTSDLSQAASATVYISNYPGTFTHHNDNLRTGQNQSETVLKPSNVGSSFFGKLFSYPVDGLIFASPLYVANVNIPSQGYHNVVYVATEHNSVYAFDADGVTSSPLWHTSFLKSGVTTVPCADVGECGDVPYEYGITSTPVIDPSTGTLYTVAKTKEGSNYVQRLHALDITTGAEKFGSPVVIQATVPGTGTGSSGGQLPFSPLRENQRTALLLSNGVVYFAFGSHGDYPPYHGWVFGYNATTLARTVAVCVTPNNDAGGIWQGGGGLATDATGNIYFATGDGTFTANTGGSDYGDCYVRMSPAGAILDYFAPHDQLALDEGNLDLCAGGVILLPDQPGPHPHILLGSGKNATLYVIDRDNMGHFNPNDDSNAIQTLPDIFAAGQPPEPGNFINPVYFNGTVYFCPGTDNLQAFPVTNGRLSTSPTSRSNEVFPYPGGVMTVSANGNTDGIIWALQKIDTTTPGVLYAYDPTNVGVVLYSSNQSGSRDVLAPAGKFSVPVVANGKVFVAVQRQLTVFGGIAPGSTSAPLPPVLATPASGSTGIATNATLTWSAATGATSYRVQVSADSTFGASLVDQSGITATAFTASGLAVNTKYFWHVSASNAGGTSAYSAAFSFTTASSNPGPVAAYAFDEGSGSTVADRSGNNLTGTIVGATWAATGKYGKALSFNGTSAYVDLGNPAQLQLTGSATWSAWINAAANPADDGQIIAKSDDNTGWQLKTTPDTGPETFGIAVSPVASAHAQRYSTTTRALNTWYYVAGVYDANAQTLNVYVNGVLNNASLVGSVAASQMNSTFNVNIGRRTVGTGGGYYFNGMIDEVRIYNRALSQAEIQTDMNTPLGSPPPAPVLAAPVNGTTGVALNPTLTWNASTGATSYRLQLSADSTFATPFVDQSGLTTTSYAASGLAVNTKYFWHVNASNASGTGAYSATFNFTTTTPPPPPPAPVLASPANGATGVATNPTLTWNASAGAASYRIQVSTDSTFATTFTDLSGQKTTSVSANGLAPATRYFWHVNATNAGGTSAYSVPFSFTTAAGSPPPSPPVLATPASGTTGVATNPTLSWNASTGAVSYRLQLSTDSTFATTFVDQSGISTTSYAATGLAVNTRYFWHVNATNSGGTSAYSTPFNFTTLPAPAGLVAAYAFDEGSGTTVADKSGNNLTGTINGAAWTAGGKYNSALSFNGTSAYVDLGNPALLQLTGSMTVSAWVNAAANPPDDGQIVAKSNDASGWQFKTTPDTGPETFGIAVSPTATGHAQRYTTTVRALNTWYYVAGVYDATAKTLSTYVNGVLNNGTLSGTVAATQVNAAVNVNIGRRLTTGTTGGFYFNGLIDEVRIYNRALSQAEIQADMNTPLGTPTPPPAPPVLASPANGTTGVATNPTLSWNASTGAASYRVQVSTDSTFATTFADQSGITTTSYAASGLAAGTRYFWHVNATNAGGTSAYSGAFSFTTSSPPPPPAVPVLATPANGATGVAVAPALTWNASTGAATYRLQLSTDSTFATTFIDQAGITTTTYTASGLANSKKYFWHVNATNAGGTSAYSGAFSFTTAALPSGLVAAYAFDEGSGTTVADKSGNNLTGTINGATWTSGKYGNALSFNGTSAYVDLGNPALLQFTGSMTVSAWVNAAANPPDDGQIVAKSNDASGWQFKTTPDTGPETFGFAVSPSAGTHTQRYTTTVRALSTWYYFAGVYDATAKTLSTYVNGVLDNGTLSGAVGATQVNAAVNVNIGRRVTTGTAGGYYFNGVIDEVRIYSRALSQAEIQSDMNTGLAAPTAQIGPAIVGVQAAATASGVNVSWSAKAGSVSRVLPPTAASGGTIASAGNAPKPVSTVEFSVSALESGGSSYQWQQDGVDIPGATGPSYTVRLPGTTPSVMRIRCIAWNQSGSDTSNEALVTSGEPASAAGPGDGRLPSAYALDQNYPNPFNPTTVISYATPKEGRVTLEVFNVVGQSVAKPVDEVLPAGYHRVAFDAHGLSSGVYFYRMTTPGTSLTRKMMVIR